MPKLIDITGKKFGKLTVISRVSNTNSQTRWNCLCDCGNKKSVQGVHLRSGHTQSCGCSWYVCGETHKSWKGYKEISSKFFSTIIANAKKRKIPFHVTIEEVWDLFLKQNKTCALSGIPIVFGANHGRVEGTASLDRINSTKGYISGNVQWVHKNVNWMKQDFSDEEFIKMCKQIANYNK